MTAISNSYVNPYGNPQLDKQLAETMSSVQGQMSLFNGTTSSTNSTNSMTREEYLESRGCTDGNNDGKIGFFSAIGNIFKGAAKMVVNTVKDIVTNPAKLLGAVATAALCVVFPPAGLALAGIGIVSGGAKIASGVANAMNAKTDAEAKAAFQDIGAGGLTVGLSVAGAKASVKSMGAGSAVGQKLGVLDKSGNIQKVKLSNVFKNSKNKFKPVEGMKDFGKAMLEDAKSSPLGKKLTISNIKNFKKTLTSQADDIANTRLNTRMTDLRQSVKGKQATKVNQALDDIDNGNTPNLKGLSKNNKSIVEEYSDLNTLKNAAKPGKNPVKATASDYVEALKSKVPSKTKITLDNLDDIKGLSTTDKTYLRSALRQGQKINPDMLSKSGQVAYKEAVGSGAFQQAKAHGIEFFKNHGNDMLQAGKQVFPYEMSKDDSSQEYLQQYYV